MRIGVVGYGTGGQHFHTAFIAAARGCSLADIVARAPETVARARADWPATPIFASLSEMIAARACDAVTITTPPQTRRALVLEAVAAVAIRKPICATTIRQRSLSYLIQPHGRIYNRAARVNRVSVFSIGNQYFDRSENQRERDLRRVKLNTLTYLIRCNGPLSTLQLGSLPDQRDRPKREIRGLT